MTLVKEGPITGLCVVSDPEKCPPGYELIYRSHDRRDDCDLWKDGFFRSKVTRYLCVTRVYPLDGGRLNNVLADICILNEREAPNQGFCLLDKTQDTGESALKKKIISVKMVPRETAQEAVCDVIILSKSKRAPVGYTLIGGDINGLTFCYKTGTIPPDSQNQLPVPAQFQQQPNLVSSGSFDATANLPNSYQLNHAPPLPAIASQGMVIRQESIAGTSSPVQDVPFQLHARYQDQSSLTQLNLQSTCIKSMADIENEFNYSFMVERSATSVS